MARACGAHPVHPTQRRPDTPISSRGTGLHDHGDRAEREHGARTSSAPWIKRVADSNRNGHATARHLVDVLRPAIVATIRSERVGTCMQTRATPVWSAWWTESVLFLGNATSPAYATTAPCQGQYLSANATSPLTRVVPTDVAVIIRPRVLAAVAAEHEHSTAPRRPPRSHRRTSQGATPLIRHDDVRRGVMHSDSSSMPPTV